MAYRRILVPLRGSAADAHVLKAAFDIATVFGSHVAAVYVRPDTAAVLRHLGRGVSVRMRQEIVEAVHDDAKHGAEAAHAALNHAAKAVDAPVQPPGKAAAGVGASFHVHEGPCEAVMTEEARLCDLSVFDSPGEAKDGDMRAALEAVLLSSRRPLLFVPPRTTQIVGTKVAVGWDGGAAAANAVLAAVPLLKRAEAIEVLHVAAGAPANSIQMERLCDYLRLQGQSAVPHAINPGSQETAAALMEAAQKSHAGLLVIGGYGHSRVRELVLGGVTRYVFANAAMPVFMAH